MDSAEFDKVAEEYLAIHSRNIRLTGEDPEFFARYKIEEVRRRWAAAGLALPNTVLDFGTGVGASLPHLAGAFPNARLTALDVSQKCLDVAQRRGVGADFVCYEGDRIPLPAKEFDLIFSSCVFHHISSEEHEGLLSQLRDLLRPGGWLVIFEHNPINPVTRYIVATCKFDENAILIPADRLKAREKAVGFSKVEVTYTGFFPHVLRFLRPLEPWLSAFPIGAQYYTLAVR